MQKRRAFKPDVDEGRLHAGQHPQHPPHVDVAHEAAVGDALDVQILENAVDQNGDARLTRRAIDEYVLHGCS